MKILLLITSFSLSGCLVTGSLEYQDPKNPSVTGRIGVSQNIDGKTIKRLRN